MYLLSMCACMNNFVYFLILHACMMIDFDYENCITVLVVLSWLNMPMLVINSGWSGGGVGS